jgi:hypothetical protein
MCLMQVRYRGHERQPQSGALGVATGIQAIEATEHLFPLVCWYAWAIIADLDDRRSILIAES